MTQKHAKLVIVSDGEKGKTFALAKSSVSIGRRGEEADIVLDDPGVSRPHCRIVRDGEGYYIEDLGSRNGTYVDDLQIKRHFLQDGDVLGVGETFLRFVLPAETGSAGTADTQTVATDAGARIIASLESEDIDSRYRPQSAEVAASGKITKNLARVYELARALETCATEAELWERVYRVLETLTPDACLSVYLTDGGEGPRLVWTASSPLPPEFSSRSVAAEVVKNRRAVLCTNLPAEADTSESIRTLGIQSAVCAPICSTQVVYGAIEAAAGDVNRPLDEDDLELVSVAASYIGLALESVRRLEAAERANAAMTGRLRQRYLLVGESEQMRALAGQTERLAAVESTVLLQGETGTGKELVAHSIHLQSPRANGPFVAINCAAIPAQLIESEFFGHEKGAFTGARSAKQGKFEAAEGGTLFLDEVGDLDLDLQARLLRVLEDREVVRVGGINPIRVDVRVIAASNRDLATLVGEERFRDDLYFRLSVVTVNLPSLREHPEDVPVLAQFFFNRFRQEIGSPAAKLSDEALAKLRGHGWPGNVRELKNVLERAVVFARGRAVSAGDIDFGPTVAPQSGSEPSACTLEEIEKRHIAMVLDRVNGNRTRAAEILGISRTGLIRKLKRFGLV